MNVLFDGQFDVLREKHRVYIYQRQPSRRFKQDKDHL